MRICSLLPSATEILYALGLGDDVLGVSHECDSPEGARGKPAMLRTVVDQERSSSAEIDGVVRAAITQRNSLYVLDEEALAQARPDLIITQQLCDVCAIDTGQVLRAIQRLPMTPRLLSLHPHTLEEVLDDILRVGEATSRRAHAQGLVRQWRERLGSLQARLADVGHRPRVFCLEWLAPPMASGHWVPEMVALAGGLEVLGRAGQPSRYVTPEEIVEAQPEVLILMPCGFSIERTRRELAVVTAQRWWHELPAVRAGRVHLADGPAYFNRSGPRLIDGVEWLAGVLHPDRCGTRLPGEGSVSRL